MQVPDDILIYITQLINRELSKEDLEKLNTWVRESDNNKQLFDKYLSYERKFNAISKWQGIDKVSDWAKVEQRLKKRSSRRLHLYIGAAAASLTIFFFISMLLHLNRNLNSSQQIAEFKDTLSHGKPSVVLTLSSGEKIQLGKSGNKIIQETNSTTINIDSTNIIKYDNNRNSAEKVAYNTVSVPKGGEFSLILSDGSRIWLNSETTIKYPVKFIGRTREISLLNGEAYFDVKKDPLKPFIVRNEKADVKVLGTSFNVMSYKDEAKAQITLVSGKVEVLKGEGSREIMPGEQAIVGSSVEGIDVEKVDTRLYTSWRDGVFYFDNTGLFELTRKLNRWYDVEFSFEDDSLMELRFSGAVTKYRPLSYLLELIEKTNNVEFRQKEKIIRISYRK